MSASRPIGHANAVFPVQLGYFHPTRPNIPLLPFAASLNRSTFIDPSVRILGANSIGLNSDSYYGPFAVLDGRGGSIQVDSNSAVLDTARLLANPNHAPGSPQITIGRLVVVSFGATVRGPSVIGASGAQTLPTFIGPGALIDGGNVSPGAYVSALARVGPGITIPTGFQVLPGANVATPADLTRPEKVVQLTPAQQTTINSQINQYLSVSRQAATGYANLYAGQSAAGTPVPPVLSPFPTAGSYFNGNIANVVGSSPSFTATGGVGPGPTFLSRHSNKQVLVQVPDFGARVIGRVNFTTQGPNEVARRLGHTDAIRSDQGQTITIASIDRTGQMVVINSPLGGRGVTIGQNFRAGNGAIVLGGPTTAATLGDNVTLGDGAIVDQSTIGSGSTIGARSYIANVTIPPNTAIPAGTILIGTQPRRTIQW